MDSSLILLCFLRSTPLALRYFDHGPFAAFYLTFQLALFFVIQKLLEQLSSLGLRKLF